MKRSLYNVRKEGHTEVVKLSLHDRRPDPNMQHGDWTPLDKITVPQGFDIVELLLRDERIDLEECYD